MRLSSFLFFFPLSHFSSVQPRHFSLSASAIFSFSSSRARAYIYIYCTYIYIYIHQLCYVSFVARHTSRWFNARANSFWNGFPRERERWKCSPSFVSRIRELLLFSLIAIHFCAAAAVSLLSVAARMRRRRLYEWAGFYYLWACIAYAEGDERENERLLRVSVRETERESRPGNYFARELSTVRLVFKLRRFSDALVSDDLRGI